VATPTIFSYTLQDDDGVKASALAYASYDGAVETVDGLIGTWLALGGLMDAVTGAVIIDGHIKIPLAADAGWKVTPVTGQSVSDTLNLVFSNDDTIYTDTVVVPALRDSLVSGGRPIITEGSAIDLLSDALEGSFTNGFYVNQTGSDLIALVSAFQGVRKHRKQLNARSRWKPTV
jgi:hypothetical protein